MDIRYGFGFDLPLLFAEAEAVRTLSIAKVYAHKVITGSQITIIPIVAT